MLRRTFLAAAATRGFAAEVRYRNYSRVLPDYLTTLAAQAYQKRLGELAKLTNGRALATRQTYIRETLWKMIGGQPERTPLNTRTVSSFERPGYRVENLIYESRPAFHIPANLYIPTSGTGPFPGVLFQMGHSLNGKAYASYQKCCQALARLGYVVLAFDPMGQGERTYYPRENGTLTRLRSADDEHTLPGRQLLLAGSTSTEIQLWDAVRSLDVLAAHPMVDPKRLASTGQSGGGTLTMLLLAVDDRLAAAVNCCGNTENVACAGFNPPGSTDDAEQNLIDGGPLTIDRWDLLYPFAPKPLLTLVSARDFFGTYSPNYLTSGREEFARLASVYRALNAADKCAWEELPLPHALSYAFRMRVYNWFERWLKGSPKPITEEPRTEPEPEQDLWATKTGNVVRDLDGRTPLMIARERAATASRPVTVKEIELALRAERPAPTTAFNIISAVPAPGGMRIEAAEVMSAVPVPAWLFHPAKDDPSKPAFIVIEPQGRAGRWGEDALYQNLAASGYLVCAPDVRGIGDLRPEYPRGQQGHASSHVSEENYAWASLILGKPLVGQRATDLLAVIAACAKLAPNRKLILAATGRMTVPALFASALTTQLHMVWLHNALKSYRDVLAKEDYTEPLANFVPAGIERCDLSAVTMLPGPKRIFSNGPDWTTESFTRLPA